MAKKYQVKKGDTLEKLGNPAAILKANPGISSLSTGQVIKLPNSIGAVGGVNVGAAQPPKVWGANIKAAVGVESVAQKVAATIVGGGGTGLGAVGSAGMPGLMQQVVNPNFPTQPSFQVAEQNYNPSPSPVFNTAPPPPSSNQVYQQPPTVVNSSSMAPAPPSSSQVNQQPTTTPSAQPEMYNGATVPRPYGVYTGNPNDPNTALWKAYWNDQAVHPPPPTFPGFTTGNNERGYATLREARQAQRARQQANMVYNQNSVYQPSIGNEVVSSVWRL